MVFHDDIRFQNLHREKALLLAIIGGFLGVHRFYLREPWAGASYLLFCWTLIPALLAIIDAVFLARMSDEEFQEEFNEVPRLATHS